MDPKVTTSFIPKKPLQPEAPHESSSVSLFMILSVVLLVAAILLAGAAFLYQGYLANSIASQGTSLQKAEAAFEPDLIRDLARLDTRITQGKKLIAAHSAITPFLDLLGKATLQNVAFQSFDYEFANGKGTVAIKGSAYSFSDLALQSDTFAKTKQIRDPIFSNLNLDQAGNVVFAFSATIDPSLLLYRNNIPAAVPIQNTQGTTAPVQGVAPAQSAQPSQSGTAPSAGVAPTRSN